MASRVVGANRARGFRDCTLQCGHRTFVTAHPRTSQPCPRSWARCGSPLAKHACRLCMQIAEHGGRLLITALLAQALAYVDRGGKVLVHKSQQAHSQRQLHALHRWSATRHNQSQFVERPVVGAATAAGDTNQGCWRRKLPNSTIVVVSSGGGGTSSRRSSSGGTVVVTSVDSLDTISVRKRMAAARGAAWGRLRGGSGGNPNALGWFVFECV